MSHRRLEKMSELLRETVAEILLRKSKDPRLKSVNITGVKVTADLKKATVSYSVLGDEQVKSETARALERAGSFVRAVVGEILGLKHTPEIKFQFDRNLEYAQHISEVLNSIRPAGEPEPDRPERGDD